MVLDASQIKQIRLNHTLYRISESIELDKPLNPPCKFKFPCTICNKNITKAQKALLCNGCDEWTHIKCNGTSEKSYEYFSLNVDPNVNWFCLVCTVKSNYENFAFTLCDNHHLYNINMSNSMSVLDYLPNEDILDETSQYPCFSHSSDNDDGELTTPELLSTKYHTAHEFQTLDLKERLNIFHSNVNGLESKFDTLSTFLAGSTTPPDLIGITETSEQNNSSFISNVSLSGYKLYSTPTNLSKGGCCIYVNDDFDAFDRADLKVQNNHFQTVWSEIK